MAKTARVPVTVTGTDEALGLAVGLNPETERKFHEMRFVLLVLMIAAPAFGQEVLKQGNIGSNTCGPCAIVNQLVFGGRKTAAWLRRIPGKTPAAKAKSITTDLGGKPSRAYKAARNRYKSTSGIPCSDMLDMANEVAATKKEPKFFSGGFLNRRKKETTAVHLQRVHRQIRASLGAGIPPILSVRSFAPYYDDKEKKHFWKGLFGHYVVITQVQEKIDDGGLSFWFKYADSDTGRVSTGTIQVENQRSFAAIRGNNVDFEWLTNRPFLTISAPRLDMGTSDRKWFYRTIITANYLIYRDPPSKKQ